MELCQKRPASADDDSWLPAVLEDVRAGQLVYLSAPKALPQPVLQVLAGLNDPRCVVASPDPKLLLDLWNLGANQLGLVVPFHRDIFGPHYPRCPYTGVEIPEAIVTHDLVLRIRNSGKRVYVLCDRPLTEKRRAWLLREEPDAVVLP